MPTAVGFAPLRLKWAQPGLGLEALGVRSADALLAPTPAELERLETLEDAGAFRRLRFVLPGSPDLRGNLGGRPGPLGTGWLWLHVYRGDLGALLRARCTSPPSASLAEREWNLLCHLRARGIGTPEPLLVGARGNGLVSGRSFLVMRAPEEAFPLPRWLRTDGHGAERARGLEALGRALALLFASGVALARLAPEDLWITPSGSGECETEDHGGLRKNKLPGVTLVAVRGARLRRDTDGARARFTELRAGLDAALSAEEGAALEQHAFRAPA